MDPKYQISLNVSPTAPYKQSRGGISPKLLMIGGGLLLAIIVAGGLMILGNSNNPAQQMQRLSAKLENLQTVLDLGDKYIQNPDLKKVHSDASILIKGDTTTLVAAMQTAGLGKIDKEIVAAETDSKSLDELNDARLNGRFDDAYKKILAQKVESTQALMREVHDKTNSQALKASLSGAYDHQSAVLDELAKL